VNRPITDRGVRKIFDWREGANPSAGATLNEPPNYNNWPLNFLATFLVVIYPPEQQPTYNRSRHLLPMPFSSAWALYVLWSFPYANLYTFSLPIRPFQAPLYTAIGPVLPVRPPRSGEGGGDLLRLWPTRRAIRGNRIRNDELLYTDLLAF